MPVGIVNLGMCIMSFMDKRVLKLQILLSLQLFVGPARFVTAIGYLFVQLLTLCRSIKLKNIAELMHIRIRQKALRYTILVRMTPSNPSIQLSLMSWHIFLNST